MPHVTVILKTIRNVSCLLLLLFTPPIAGQLGNAVARPLMVQQQQAIYRPHDMQRQFHRARTAFESGASLLEAKARLDQVIEALPDDREARKLRAQVLLTMNKPAEAFIDAQHAVSLNDFDGEAHVLRCESGATADQRESAHRSLDRAAHFMLRDADLYTRLSACALELGDVTKAESLARVALARAPDSPMARMHLARVFMATGQNDMAARALLEGLEKRVLRPADVRRNGHIAPIMNHPALAPWRRR